MYKLKMSKNDDSPDVLLHNFVNKPSLQNYQAKRSESPHF